MPVVGSKPVRTEALVPHWQTSDGETVRLYLGNVTDVLARLPEKSVHQAVTSPPYWGLRDYGTGTWSGGDPGCDHVKTPTTIYSARPASRDGRTEPDPISYQNTCGKCGATRTDQQLGSEATPDCRQLREVEPGLYRRENCAEREWATACHVCRMVLVFRGVRRVLRDDGTLFVNYGDSYTGGGGFSPGSPSNQNGGSLLAVQDAGTGAKPAGPKYRGLPAGNLVGVPWRVALALQADGWILRQDIIWHKVAPMPESVRNRCTKAHEYVFLLAKKPGYYYDAEAIREKLKPGSPIWGEAESNKPGWSGSVKSSINEIGHALPANPNGANKRSVWSVSSGGGYGGSHFATFPVKLISPMILAGTSAHGCCGTCGTPWRRMTEERQVLRDRPNDFTKRTGEEGTGNSCGNTVAGVAVRTVGWEPGCGCGTEDVVPCTVLDPFCGSSTTNIVALDHGRRSVGIDLSKTYLDENAVPRVTGQLLARPDMAHLAGKRVRARVVVPMGTTPSLAKPK